MDAEPLYLRMIRANTNSIGAQADVLDAEADLALAKAFFALMGMRRAEVHQWYWSAGQYAAEVWLERERGARLRNAAKYERAEEMRGRRMICAMQDRLGQDDEGIGFEVPE